MAIKTRWFRVNLLTGAEWFYKQFEPNSLVKGLDELIERLRESSTNTLIGHYGRVKYHNAAEAMIHYESVDQAQAAIEFCNIGYTLDDRGQLKTLWAQARLIGRYHDDPTIRAGIRDGQYRFGCRVLESHAPGVKTRFITKIVSWDLLPADKLSHQTFDPHYIEHAQNRRNLNEIKTYGKPYPR